MTNRVVPIISKFHEFLMISFLMKTPLPSSKVDTIFGFFCFPFLCRFFFASLFLQQILEKSRFHLSFRFAFLFFTGWTNCRRWLFVSFCLFVFWWFCRRCWTTTTKAFRGRASATWWRTGRCCVVRSCRGPPSSSPPTTTSSSSSPRSTRRPSSTGSSKTSAAPSKRWVWLCGCVRAPGPRPFLFFFPPFFVSGLSKLLRTIRRPASAVVVAVVGCVDVVLSSMVRFFFGFGNAAVGRHDRVLHDQLGVRAGAPRPLPRPGAGRRVRRPRLVPRPHRRLPRRPKGDAFLLFCFFFHFFVPFFLALFFFFRSHFEDSFFCVSLVQCLRDPSFTESYRVLPSFWRCFFFKFSGHFQRSALVILVLPNLTEFYRVYLGVFEVDIFIFGLFSRQCSSDPSFTDSYRVLPSFTEFLTLHLLFSSHFQRSFTCFT